MDQTIGVIQSEEGVKSPSIWSIGRAHPLLFPVSQCQAMSLSQHIFLFLEKSEYKNQTKQREKWLERASFDL